MRDENIMNEYRMLKTTINQMWKAAALLHRRVEGLTALEASFDLTDIDGLYASKSEIRLAKDTAVVKLDNALKALTLAENIAYSAGWTGDTEIVVVTKCCGCRCTVYDCMLPEAANIMALYSGLKCIPINFKVEVAHD